MPSRFTTCLRALAALAHTPALLNAVLAAKAATVHTISLSTAEMRPLKLPARYIELHGHF